MSSKPREIVAGGLAIRSLSGVPSQNGKPSVGFRVPGDWARQMGWTPGDMVLCSRKGNSVTVTKVDEKELLRMLAKTEVVE